jgi:N-methylhydantoinase A
VREQVQALVDRGARGFVVSLLWSFLNPQHELEILDIIRSEYPDTYLGNVPVVCSHQISPRGGEYTRTMTAIVDAYTHQQISSQLWTIGEMVRDAGYTKPLALVHNNGGSKKVARTRAIDTHGAGPVAGVLGSAYLARQ